MIDFACQHCGRSLQVPDSGAGKKGKCKHCGDKVVVPDASDVEFNEDDDLSLDDFDAAPALSSFNLIPCGACGSQIAQTAKACPTCGAPNTWFHPEVQRFIDNYRTISVPSECQYKWTAFTVSGTASVDRSVSGIAMKIRFGGLLLGLFLGPVGWTIMTIGFLVSMVASFSPTKTEDFLVAFQIDFSGPKPKWESTDDEFWSGVKEFFNTSTSRRKTKRKSSVAKKPFVDAWLVTTAKKVSSGVSGFVDAWIVTVAKKFWNAVCRFVHAGNAFSARACGGDMFLLWVLRVTVAVAFVGIGTVLVLR